jgi:hypothetical protein
VDRFFTQPQQVRQLGQRPLVGAREKDDKLPQSKGFGDGTLAVGLSVS